MAEEDLTKKILDSMDEAVEIETKEGKVRNPSISEKIKAAQFAAGAQASQNGAPFGIRIARTVHTGEFG